MTVDSETKVTVCLDGRRFIVRFLGNRPMSIKERKIYAQGKPFEALYDAPYWHHSHKIGSNRTKPARIIKAARIAGRIPNDETLEAMKDADSGRVSRFDNVDSLIEDLSTSLAKISELADIPNSHIQALSKGQHRKRLQQIRACVRSVSIPVEGSEGTSDR